MGALSFSPELQPVIADFVPICHELVAGRGRYAIAIGGSQGKGTWDSRSDVDFRLFYEQDLPGRDVKPGAWRAYDEAIARWGRQGVIVDGVWARQIGAIDAALDRWLSGQIQPDDIIWTIWGYHLLPDIYHQAIIEDPDGVIAGWKERLRTYPARLKQAVLDSHVASVRYWQSDYHYRNKVRRGDVVFTAGLSAKLVHNLIQILFALNETYYVGDGQNLDFVRRFKLAPPEFDVKVQRVLYPAAGDDALERQYQSLMGLCDEVLALAAA